MGCLARMRSSVGLGAPRVAASANALRTRSSTPRSSTGRILMAISVLRGRRLQEAVSPAGHQILSGGGLRQSDRELMGVSKSPPSLPDSGQHPITIAHTPAVAGAFGRALQRGPH